MNKREAEAAGFTVDTTVYPWFAYKGHRFRPDESRTVLTDLEAEFALWRKTLTRMIAQSPNR